MFGKALFVVTGALAALAVATVGAAADPVADFYKGKTIKVTLPVGPGGTFGMHALILAEHIGRYLPGNPTVVPEFMPGAGGIRAINYAFNAAPKDGTTIVMPYPAGVLAQHTQKDAVKFDMGKFQYIGRMADTTRVLLIWHTAPAQTIEEIKKTEVVLSASGKTSNTYIHPAMMNALIGTKFKIIPGFTGSASEATAIERGEVHGGTSSWVSLTVNHPHWLRDKKVKLLVQIGLKPIPELKGVPLLQDLVTDPGDRKVVQYMVHTSDIGYSFMAHPEVPAARIAALRKAYADMVKDPRVIADAKKRGIVVNYASGEELAEIVRDAIATPQALVDRFVALSN